MSSTTKRLNLGLDRFSGLYIWAGVILLFSVWKPTLFPTNATATNIASSQAVTALLAIGLLIPLAAGAFDLSIGAVVNLSTILVVVLQTTHGWSMWTAIIAAIVCSLLIGVVNGFLVTKVGISSLIATLGMATVITAVQSIASGNTQPLPPLDPRWIELTQRSVLGVPAVVIYLIVIAAVIWWMLECTPVGRYLYAIGGNLEAARLSGLKPDRYVWFSLALSSAIAGIAGVLYASLFGPSLTYGPSLLLPAFAAAFLGSTQVKPGRFNVLGTLIAIYMLATGVQGLQFVTGVQWLSDMFNGLALIIAVGFAAWRQRRLVNRPAKRNGSANDDTREKRVWDDTGADSGPAALVVENVEAVRT